jgi:hypothetical protein
MLETIPPDHTGVDPDRPLREIRVEVGTYEEAREHGVAELPGGWQSIWIRTT